MKIKPVKVVYFHANNEEVDIVEMPLHYYNSYDETELIRQGLSRAWRVTCSGIINPTIEEQEKHGFRIVIL